MTVIGGCVGLVLNLMALTVLTRTYRAMQAAQVNGGRMVVLQGWWLRAAVRALGAGAFVSVAIWPAWHEIVIAGLAWLLVAISVMDWWVHRRAVALSQTRQT